MNILAAILSEEGEEVEPNCPNSVLSQRPEIATDLLWDPKQVIISQNLKCFIGRIKREYTHRLLRNLHYLGSEKA